MVTSGKVCVFDKPAGAKDLRAEIGYMTQAISVYPDLTVGENLGYFAAIAGVPYARSREVLEEVDLVLQANQMVSTLSGGQKSRVSLAVALLGNPKLLVLDEPTVGVDPVLREQLWNLFRKMVSDGRTIIVSSHVMEEATRYDELILVRGGELLAHASPSEICNQTRSQTVEESFLKIVGESI
jgi:ABC-2 type transport system ATP-binding protein